MLDAKTYLPAPAEHGPPMLLGVRATRKLDYHVAQSEAAGPGSWTVDVCDNQ